MLTRYIGVHRGGLNESHALIVFYNSLIDTAVFTVWEARKEGRRIVDID